MPPALVRQDVAAELGKRLGMHVAYAAEFEELSQEHGGKAFIGQATLTRLPILKSRVLHFQTTVRFLEAARLASVFAAAHAKAARWPRCAGDGVGVCRPPHGCL